MLVLIGLLVIGAVCCYGCKINNFCTAGTDGAVLSMVLSGGS